LSSHFSSSLSVSNLLCARHTRTFGCFSFFFFLRFVMPALLSFRGLSSHSRAFFANFGSLPHGGPPPPFSLHLSWVRVRVAIHVRYPFFFLSCQDSNPPPLHDSPHPFSRTKTLSLRTLTLISVYSFPFPTFLLSLPPFWAECLPRHPHLVAGKAACSLF